MSNTPSSADAVAGRHLQIAGVDTLVVLVNPSARIHTQRAVDVGTRIHRFDREAKPKTEQDLDQAGRCKCGQPRVRNRFRQTKVDVLAKPGCDLILEKLSQAPMLRIDATQ